MKNVTVNLFQWIDIVRRCDSTILVPRAHARYLVHPKLLFRYIVVKNAILCARARLNDR